MWDIKNISIYARRPWLRDWFLLRGFGLVAVEEDGGYDEKGAEAELQAQREVKDKDGGHTCDDDGQRTCKALRPNII